jgi:hypothetical protein
MRKSRFLFACAFAALLAPPVFGQTSLSATPVGPFEDIADCSYFIQHRQPFDSANFGAARVSDVQVGIRMFDNFFDGPLWGPVSGIRFWGIEIDFGSPTFLCAEDDLANFNLAFWGGDIVPDISDLKGEENDIFCVETDTGVPFGEYGNVVQYDCGPYLDFGPARWMSVQRMDDQDDCFWLWVDEQGLGTYDDQAYQENGSGLVTSDQTFCLASIGDDDVPATTGIGVALIVLLLGGSSAYFLRRK